jgi:hypothetical protein
MSKREVLRASSRLSRGHLLVSALVFATLGSYFMYSSFAAGTDDEIHYTIISPTAVTFDWRGTDTDIRYGLTSSYGSTVTAHTITTGDPFIPYSSAGPFQEAKLTGLSSGTTYHYSIGGGSDKTFNSAPVAGTAGFNVDVIGDVGSTVASGSDAAIGMTVMQNMIAADSPKVVIVVGDLTYANASSQASVDAHFNEVMPWSQSAAYMPAWGNHEWDKTSDNLNNYKGRFDFPNPQSSPGTSSFTATGGGKDWYWFDYGNTRFISYPDDYVSAAWTDFNTKVDPIMSQAQSDSNIKWIVTYGHRPPYSSGFHSSETTLQNFMNALGDKYNKYVLNLNGHSHNYERTFPQHGITYVTAGTGGNYLENGSCSNGWNSVNGSCNPPSFSASRWMRYGVTKLNFGATSITGNFVCGPAGGSEPVIDSCTQGTVVDSFTIGTSGDTTPPTVSLTAPAAGATLSAAATLSASASDNVGVTKVDFLVDGVLKNTDTTSPYSFSWDTTTATNGSHSLQAKAYDAAGNTTTSSAVSVTVSNACPSGDDDGDCHVTITDLSILLSNWDSTTNATCDFNHNGVVDIFDLSILLTNYCR